MTTAALQVGDEVVNGVGNHEIEDFSVQRCVVAGRTTKADDLTVAEFVLTRTLHGVDDLRCMHVYDVKRYLGVGKLFLARIEDTEELDIARLASAELGDIARNRDLRTLQTLLLASEIGLARNFFHIVAIDDGEPVCLLQVRLQDRLGLIAESV